MNLSNELITQFVKVTNDNTETKSETTVYGTVIERNGSKYVRIDGSEILTPISDGSTTVDVKNGERVTVMIKNHTATVTGNITNPSGRNSDVVEVKETVKDYNDLKNKVVEVETVVAKKVSTDEFYAETGRIEGLVADKLSSHDASITYATIDSLESSEAEIKGLIAKKLDAESAELQYANIGFTNVDSAAIDYLFTKAGLIETITAGDGTFTRNLIGVTISGDLITGNTIIADKLVIQGEDGLYYKLNTDGITVEAEQTEYNSLNGEVILAQSITATKINVDDLVAFDATIGGFNITADSIYSGVKETIDNTTRGIYLDNNGQVAFGDSDQYIKYYKDSDGNYALDIVTDGISFGDDYLYLAKNSRSATIDLCNGLAKLYHTIDDAGYSIFNIDTTYGLSYIKMSAPMHDLLVLENTSRTNGVIIKGMINGTTVGGFGLVRDGHMVRYGSDADEDNPVEYRIHDEENFGEIDSEWHYGGVLGENFTLYDNDYQVQYRKVGKIVQIRGQVRPVTVITGSTQNHLIFTLPVGYRPSAQVWVRCQGSGAYSWLLTITTSGQVRFARYNDGANYVDTSDSSWLPFHVTFLID